MENDETDAIERYRALIRELDIIFAAAGLPPVQEEGQDSKAIEFKPKLVEQIAENMAIYAGAKDDAAFLSLAKELLRRFRAIKGRDPVDYLEVEEWSASTVDKSGRFSVFSGGNAARKS
jgi:hypothetical protein